MVQLLCIFPECASIPSNLFHRQAVQHDERLLLSALFWPEPRESPEGCKVEGDMEAAPGAHPTPLPTAACGSDAAAVSVVLGWGACAGVSGFSFY